MTPETRDDRHPDRTPRERSAGAGRGQRGFALAVTLLLLVGISTLAAAGVWVAQSDTRTTLNAATSSRAFHLADAGMSRFLGEESGIPSTPATYSFPEGSAVVTSERLGVFANGHELYRLRAEAQLTQSPRTTRTITTLAMLDPLALDLPGGLSSGNNVRKTGTAGQVSGVDAAASGDCPEAPRAARPGIVARDYQQNGGGGGGSTGPNCNGPICGNPPIVETSNPLGSMSIDWQGILNGTVVDFDHVVSSPANWPSVGSQQWPVIFVDNTSRISLSNAAGHSGQGLLIIRGDVKLEGDFHWDGAMMIGGSLKSAGNNVVTGATVVGLNELIGINEEDTDLGNGEKTFQYHSCNLLRALKEAGTLHQVPGSWREVI